MNEFGRKMNATPGAAWVASDHPRTQAPGTPGNGRFVEKPRTGDDISLTAPASAPAPFVFDRDYGNYEQVRPYFAEYCAVLAELENAGQYPYNNSFKGRVPSLAGASDKDEDTAIYMLQSMHSRDDMDRKVAQFAADGGYDVEELDGSERRGTIAKYGFYVGGTGWEVLEDVRVKRQGNRTLYKRPRQREWRVLDSSRALFQEGTR